MRLRLTRGPLVCLRHVTLFLYCVLQRLLRREETYLTINSPNNHLLTLLRSSPSWCLPVYDYATAHTLRDTNHNRKHADLRPYDKDSFFLSLRPVSYPRLRTSRAFVHSPFSSRAARRAKPDRVGGSSEKSYTA